MFLSKWREFPSGALPCRKKNLTVRVSMLLKSRVSLTYFRACFLPGRAKDLSAPRYSGVLSLSSSRLIRCDLNQNYHCEVSVCTAQREV
jgi:hypothetical protein